MDDDGDCTVRNSCGSQPSNGMANGKGGRVDLEDANAGQEDPFRREGGVELAEEQRAAVCEQEDRAIPANVVKGAKGVGDARDFFRDDGSILRDFVSIGLPTNTREGQHIAKSLKEVELFVSLILTGE